MTTYAQSPAPAAAVNPAQTPVAPVAPVQPAAVQPVAPQAPAAQPAVQPQAPAVHAIPPVFQGVPAVIPPAVPPTAPPIPAHGFMMAPPIQQPVQPAQYAQPAVAQPADPQVPVQPATPQVPAPPQAPVAPAAPVVPTTPTTPVAPTIESLTAERDRYKAQLEANQAALTRTLDVEFTKMAPEQVAAFKATYPDPAHQMQMIQFMQSMGWGSTAAGPQPPPVHGGLAGSGAPQKPAQPKTLKEAKKRTREEYRKKKNKR